jgi:hypothetical protein
MGRHSGGLNSSASSSVSMASRSGRFGVLCPSTWQFWLGVLVLALGLLSIGVAKADATTASLGLQYGGPYAQSRQDMEAVTRSGAHYWRIGMGCTQSWTELDNEVELAWKHSLTVIVYVQSACNGSREFPAYEEAKPSEEWHKWETWIFELVHRYGTSGSFWSGKASPDPITVWELWNEPNHGNNNPGGTKVLPEAYGRFLKRSAWAVKQAQGEVSPGAGTTILIGGLITTATGTNSEGIESLNVKTFLEKLYAVSNVGEKISGVGLHPYAFGNNSAATVEANINAARTNLDEHSKNLPIWVTEVGWPVSPEAPSTESSFSPVSAEEQANLANQLFAWYEGHQSEKHLEALVYYFYRDYNWDGRWDSFTGLRKDASHSFSEVNFRPAWYTFQIHTGASRWPVPSEVATSAATGVGTENASIGYSGNAHGLPTRYRLEWGPTIEYGSTRALPEHWEESHFTELEAIGGLQPGTTYHYRVVATNENAEVSSSPDRSFSTPGSASPVIAPASGGGWQGIFWRGSDNALFETDAPSGEWESWSPTWSGKGIPAGVTPVGTPAIAPASGGGWQGIFWRGSDGNIYETDAPKGEWESFSPTWSRKGIPAGVSVASDPVVAPASGGGWQGIFWRGSDGALFETDAPKAEWESWSPTWSRKGIPAGVTVGE